MKENPEKTQKLANANTNPKESNQKQKQKDSKEENTIEISNFGKIDINYIDKNEDVNFFKPKAFPEGPTEKQIEFWKKLLSKDEKDNSEDLKISSLRIWDDYFDKYKKICEILKIKTLEFDKNAEIFDNYKDKLAEILSGDVANSRMDILVYGTKRIMIEIMSKMIDPKLNCIIYFLFQAMLDIMLLREEFIATLGGKAMTNMLFDDFTTKLKELEIIKTEIIQENNKVSSQKLEFEKLNQKLRILESKTNFSALKFKEFNLKASEFIKTNDINSNKWFDSIDNILDRLKKCEEKTSGSNFVNQNKIFGMIRKLNARCQGLHYRIADLEDKFDDWNENSLQKENSDENKSANDDSQSRSDDEYEEIDDSEYISGDLDS